MFESTLLAEIHMCEECFLSFWIWLEELSRGQKNGFHGEDVFEIFCHSPLSNKSCFLLSGVSAFGHRLNPT